MSEQRLYRTSAERRAARKEAERAAKAAAIEAAWMRHMYQELPAERAAAEPSRPEWPAGLPRPNKGFAYPAIRALAAWVNIPYRRFEKHEIRQMIRAWARAVEDAGLPVDLPSELRGRK